MSDFGIAPTTVPVMAGGLADSLFETAQRDPALPQIARRDPAAPDTWIKVSAAEVRDEVVDLAKGLVASGIRPGNRVAVMARTRYEWTVLGYALWSVGAEIVPIYPTSSREQVEWILRDAACVGVVVEDEQGVMTVGSVCAKLPLLRHVWQLDDDSLPRLMEAGRGVPDATVDSLRRIVMPDSTALIAYTSGTTGRPKGCALSHRSLAGPCDVLLAGWRHTAAAPGEQPAFLAFLPFSHVYGLMIQGMCLRGGLLLGHEPDLRDESLSAAIRSFRPTYLYGVPYVFEKIYKNFLRTAQQSGRGQLFERAARTARDHALAVERHRLDAGPGPGMDLRLQHALYDKTVYRKLRAALGGRVRGGCSGGSPLNRELTLFYAGIGIHLHDGYGLTETAGGITAQPVGREKFGTVGRPLPGTEIRVARDGEILVNGPSVFQGYINDEAGTRAALQDGWLATGDIGRLDSEGYLSITGRKKDIVITSGGKAVAPAPLEEQLRMHPLIHQAVVVGDNRPCVGVLITLDPEFLAHWRGALSTENALLGREAREENALRQEVLRAIAAANSTVSRSESIRVFRILPEPFDLANGMLTPSMKLRRDTIVQRYAAEIEAMYATARAGRRTAPDDLTSWDDADDVFRRVRP
ncbi:long-chain fatty acid--CoA ligase [Streptomyces ipomoeae]|jgi:long-chain acyl-CoA synthetase|uniref:AMP-binding enzyme n=2 Tax=Streptomyces ipomoeae TaxID=103232 RepID=L1KTT9_9ACTN|nr:AMP-dependent synthetase/ligase [Streptomyces ipomoeae]EKX63865.1 AMP-binding enzyme [Streptomyces ipomoeae 91-03]MDX2693868.1 AMP-dependent synthetase/ligase [Streptomyces ipomoeae]MDX2822898.1 AMP-dependent synthetase/ligase [Streptomyces ipomoeae]MDX2838627.1 AMP-dependent synthetase/ligase [Streptomyces ipomoeae]MDX2872463.1 AMP-dependent synthetase/ligase [Streptomyces ipomoeae]